jgi:hypothetical protein
MTKKIKTLDAARQSIAELEAQLGGKQAPTIEPSGSVTVLKPSAKVTDAIKRIAAAVSTSGSLPTLEAISRELKGEDSSSARITYLNGVVGDYQNAISAARKAKDYAAETNLFRSLHKISKRHAEEVMRDPVARKKIWQTPIEDLS